MQKKSKLYNPFTIIAGILVGFLALNEAGKQFPFEDQARKDSDYTISILKINQESTGSNIHKKLYSF